MKAMDARRNKSRYHEQRRIRELFLDQMRDGRYLVPLFDPQMDTNERAVAALCDGREPLQFAHDDTVWELHGGRTVVDTIHTFDTGLRESVRAEQATGAIRVEGRMFMPSTERPRL